jgi:glycosyltransferase involved in cell wall biosynthesis
MVMGVTHPQTCLVMRSRLRVLRQSGFRVVLVASPGALLDETAAREGAEAVAIPIRRRIAPVADLISFWRLWRLLGRLRPNLVEFSTPKAGLLGTLAAWLRRVPKRVYLLRGLRLEGTSGLKHWILLTAERLTAACAHTVLCNSASLRQIALDLKIASAGKLRVIGEGSSQGVDTERFSPGPTDLRERLGIPAAAPVIGYVGRLTRDKGLPELVEAFEQISIAMPTARLLLVGWYDVAEDALDAGTRACIEAHPRIVTTGFVADAAPYYRAMDLLVLPSWREGFPNVVLEAGATGIPAVTTISTGARDSVIPEVTGLLIPPGYPQAIVEAVLKLLRDPARRERMGRAARAWVVENYREERVLGQTAEYYWSLLGVEAAQLQEV